VKFNEYGRHEKLF